MAAWNALAVEEQEKVIGRAKVFGTVQLNDDVKPSNSHVALNTVVEPDGTQRQILRENMPFGCSACRCSARTSLAMPPHLRSLS